MVVATITLDGNQPIPRVGLPIISGGATNPSRDVCPTVIEVIHETTNDDLASVAELMI